MWVLMFVFIIAMLAWSGVLWLLLTIDIFDYSLPAIVGMHLVPPLIVVAIWIAIRYWRKHRLSSRQQEQEEARQKELKAEHDKQKKVFDDALRQRRVPVECRWAAVGDLVEQAPTVKCVGDTEQTRTYASMTFMTDRWPHTSLLPMLEDLYRRAPIVGGLPIAFCGPSSEASVDLARGLRTTHTLALQTGQTAPMTALSTSIFEVVPLSIRGQSIYAALLDLFTSRPDLPGIVVVAFDSVMQDVEDEDEWAKSETPQPPDEIEKWCGKPGRALTVQLITPTVLTAVLSKIDTLPDNVALNAMTPHWERERIPAGMAGWLAQWPKSQREALARLIPIAALHASSSTSLAQNLLSARSRQQAATTVTEAAVNAGLFDPAFVAEGETPPPSTPIEIENCGWLVHNAGDVAHGGDRVALLTLALIQHGVEINPVDQANAVVTEFGHCGEAARWLWLTLAIQRAALLRQHVVLAEFDAKILTISFVAAAVA